MIGHEYAQGAHAETIGGAKEGNRRGLVRVPTRTGYRRLLDSLGGSVLVQLMLAMTLVAVAAMLYLAQASQASVIEVNITALQDQRANLQLQNAQLDAQSTSLQSLSRISSLASTQLKMTRGDLSTAIWVQPELPRVVPVRTQEADEYAAIRASQPLAAMQSYLRAFIASL